MFLKKENKGGKNAVATNENKTKQKQQQRKSLKREGHCIHGLKPVNRERDGERHT